MPGTRGYIEWEEYAPYIAQSSFFIIGAICSIIIICLCSVRIIIIRLLIGIVLDRRSGGFKIQRVE